MSRNAFMLAGAIAVAAAGGAYAACEVEGEDNTDRTNELAIEVHPEFELPLRDNPSQRPTQIVLAVDGVHLHHAGIGWIDLESRGIFDLLDPTDEWPTMDAGKRIPDGTYDKIRFEVQFAAVKVDRKWYPLEIPSGDTSGLKIDAAFCLLEGEIDVLTLKWDVDESLKYNEQKGYWMNPVIKPWSPPTCTDDLRTPPVDNVQEYDPQREIGPMRPSRQG